MPDPKPTEVGVCPACGKIVRLSTTDGRVAPHASSILSWLDCGGAGYRPKKPKAATR